MSRTASWSADHRHDDRLWPRCTRQSHSGRTDGRAVFAGVAAPLAGAVIMWRGRPDLVADDGVKAVRAGNTAWVRPVKSIASSESVRQAYSRTLTGTLQYRPVVLVLWAMVATHYLTVPFYMFSQRELAPTRAGFSGRGRRLTNWARSTRRSCSRPSTTFIALQSDSIFQITFPTGGFGGMTTKPWSGRPRPPSNS